MLNYSVTVKYDVFTCDLEFSVKTKTLSCCACYNCQHCLCWRRVRSCRPSANHADQSKPPFSSRTGGHRLSHSPSCLTGCQVCVLLGEVLQQNQYQFPFPSKYVSSETRDSKNSRCLMLNPPVKSFLKTAFLFCLVTLSHQSVDIC